VERKIKVNGVEYESPECMPPEVRKLYDEALQSLGNNAQDPLGGTSPAGGPEPGVHFSRSVVINGKTYRSVDELPPEMRELYAKILNARLSGQGMPMKAVLELSLGILGSSLTKGRGALPGEPASPVMVEATHTIVGTSSLESTPIATPMPTPTPIDPTPITSDSSSGELGIRLVLIALALLVGAVIVVLLLRSR
jgi:hypothetical protein